MRRIAGAVIAAAALGTSMSCGRSRVASRPDPASARRFEIVGVSDSTFAFLAAGMPWVRPGIIGISVDPKKGDALMAQFVVRARIGDTAIALVTGQTARVLTTHVALLERPHVGMLRQRGFWMGVFAGGAIGAATAITAR